MPHTRKRSFYPKPSSLCNQLFFEKSSATMLKNGLRSKQILNKKNLQPVRFQLLKITTRQILFQKFYKASKFGLKKYNALDFELKFFSNVRFWKNVCTQKSRFGSFYSSKTTYFTFLCCFKSMIPNWNYRYVSDFQFKNIQRVRFLSKIFTTRQ